MCIWCQAIWYHLHDSVMEIQWWKIYIPEDQLGFQLRIIQRKHFEHSAAMTSCLRERSSQHSLTCAALQSHFRCCSLCPPAPSWGCTWWPPTSGSSSPRQGTPQRKPPCNTSTHVQARHQLSLAVFTGLSLSIRHILRRWKGEKSIPCLDAGLAKLLEYSSSWDLRPHYKQSCDIGKLVSFFLLTPFVFAIETVAVCMSGQ